MQEPAYRENYPILTVIVANLVTLFIYIIGIGILSRFSLLLAFMYVLFAFALEWRLVSGHCRDCYYYGKTCAFGKGRIAAWFVPKGDPQKFACLKITAKDLLPDFLAFIVPALAGIWLLFADFSVTLLLLVIALFLLGFLGNALVRGQLACRYCRQREIGCPAERLFRKRDQA